MSKMNQPRENESELLTVAEVAELDRCSEKTVRRAIAAGFSPQCGSAPAGASCG
jgi:hypothetical protein